MGRGWRRAFCTAMPADLDVIPGESSPATNKQHRPRLPPPSSSFASGRGNPSTPRSHSHSHPPPPAAAGNAPNLLRCRTTTAADFQMPSSPADVDGPKLQRTSTAPMPTRTRSPSAAASGSSSPRTPLKFSIFKSGLCSSRSNCGVCLHGTKGGKGTAVFTAECGHAFHFSCIAAHVRGRRSLICPLCSSPWNDAPLLFPHQHGPKPPEGESPAPVEHTTGGKPRSGRAYDDDEPLLSPTTGARCVPIPEVDEDGDGRGDEEFQGFFSAANSSSNVEVKLLQEAALIAAGKGQETYAVALRVKAPSLPCIDSPSRRAPVDLVTVLDVSGSMTGAKLLILKRAVGLVISSLGSADRLSIIAFAATPRRLLPLKRMTARGRRAARLTVEGLACGRGTGVADALKKATKVLEDRRERNPVATVILLSDGHDSRNGEVPVHRRRVPGGARFSHVEIPVQSFDFGAEPAEDAFVKCVGGLLSVVAQDLRLQLLLGSAAAEISAVYSCNGRPSVLSSGYGDVRVGDLYAEEDKELLVELRVPATAAGPDHVMSVRCSYKDPASQELVYSSEQVLVVPRPGPTRSASSSSAAKVQRLRCLYIAARAVAESRRLAEQEELAAAEELLVTARAALVEARAAWRWADEYLRCVEAELGELRWRRLVAEEQVAMMRRIQRGNENEEQLTPTSSWRAAERLARMAMMKSIDKVGDLHGFENARF